MFDKNENGVKYENKMVKLFGSRDLFLKFQECDDIATKLGMVWRAPLIQTLLKESVVTVAEKSEGETRRNRDLGNKHYQAGRWMEATNFFSDAACFAPQSTSKQGRDYSLALANRSAALFHLGLFHECLEDVRLAREAGYPTDLRHKVSEREVYCKLRLGDLGEAKSALQTFKQDLQNSKLDAEKRSKVIQETEDAVNKGCGETVEKTVEGKPWLKIPAIQERHATLPALTSSIEIQFEESRGRHAVATRDIEIGSVVLVEEPAVACLHYDKRRDHCDNCLIFIPIRQIPCDFCSALRFCSVSCKTSALAGYHKYECGREDLFESVIGQMLKEGKTQAEGTKKFHKLALKTVTQKSLKWFKENRTLLQQTDKSSKVFSEAYAALSALVSHHAKRPLPELEQKKEFSFLMSAVFHLRNLQLSGYFGHKKTKVYESLTEDEAYIGFLLYSYLEKLQYNTHSIIEGRPDSDKETSIEYIKLGAPLYENKMRAIGSGMYPTLALFNHSCYNNIYKFNVGKTVVAVASQTIRAGEEVTENYFPLVHVLPRPERRIWLQQYYRFDCYCRGCRANLPTLKEMYSDPTVLRCLTPRCPGKLLEDDEKCVICNNSLDKKAARASVTEVWSCMKETRLNLHSQTSFAELKILEQSVRENYNKIVRMCDMPSSLVYEAELMYWRAIRLVHGNRSY